MEHTSFSRVMESTGPEGSVLGNFSTKLPAQNFPGVCKVGFTDGGHHNRPRDVPVTSRSQRPHPHVFLGKSEDAEQPVYSSLVSLVCV